MKRPILTLFPILCFWTMNAQYAFKSDLTYKPRDITYLDSIFHIEKEFEFQLRVWTGGGLLPTHSLFVLTATKDSLSVRYFKLQKVDSVGTLEWAETFINNADISNYWTYIDTRHIRQLPSMRKIFRKYRIEETRSYDGSSYWIELFSKSEIRGSRFYCPKSNSRNYPNAVEFKWVTEIIEATYNLVNEQWGLCRKTTANMGFSAMLADDYMLIVPFAYHL